VAAERGAIHPCPEDLVDQARTVGDLVHFAEVRAGQQSSPAWAPPEGRRPGSTAGSPSTPP